MAKGVPPPPPRVNGSREKGPASPPQLLHLPTYHPPREVKDLTQQKVHR